MNQTSHRHWEPKNNKTLVLPLPVAMLEVPRAEETQRIKGTRRGIPNCVCKWSWKASWRRWNEPELSLRIGGVIKVKEGEERGVSVRACHQKV